MIGKMKTIEDNFDLPLVEQFLWVDTTADIVLLAKTYTKIAEEYAKRFAVSELEKIDVGPYDIYDYRGKRLLDKNELAEALKKAINALQV